MARTPKASVEERNAKVKERTEEALQSFLGMIESGNFPAQLGRMAMLTIHSDAPAAKWSAGNQLLMIQQGTADARGYRQWQEVGRQVKKGSKATYIFSPRTVLKKTEDEATGKEVKKPVLVGFGLTPVFAIEQTDGEPVPGYDPPKLPPLIEVAESFGVSVKYAPSPGDYAGYYQPGSERIVLCTHAERVFFHELAHAAHYRLKENAATANSDKVRKEIVAETAAAALSTIYGFTGYEVASTRYIQEYAGTAGNNEATLREIMRYVGEVRDVLTLILRTEEDVRAKGEAA